MVQTIAISCRTDIVNDTWTINIEITQKQKQNKKTNQFKNRTQVRTEKNKNYE